MRRFKQGNKFVLGFSVLWVILFFAQGLLAEDYQYGFGMTPSISTGDYGTGEDMDVFYLPLVFKFYPQDRVRASVSVPWIYQSSTQVISASGMFHRVTGMNNIDNRKMGFGLTPGFYMALLLQGSTSIDAVVGGDYQLRPGLSLNGYLLVGLSDSSPDFGLGIGLLDKL